MGNPISTMVSTMIRVRVMVRGDNPFSTMVGTLLGLGETTSVPDTCFELIGSHQWYADPWVFLNPRLSSLKPITLPT